MASDNIAITEVWSYNLLQQLRKLDQVLYDCSIVSIDTEFPGFLVNTPRYCPDDEKYEDLKTNVDAMKIIQLGLTVADEVGNVGGVWQFNFSFCTETDIFSHDSLQFLKRSGINFERLEKLGIDWFWFSNMFTSVLRKHQNLEWVTFHGLYDLGHFVKLLTNRPLPDSLLGFTQLIGNVFGRVVDTKYLAAKCEGLLNGELGLEKLADILEVERVGGAHQAGSDSLVTSLVFSKIKDMYEPEESDYVGYLYGIHANICTSQQLVPFPIVSYCHSQQNAMFIHLGFPPQVVCNPHAMHTVSRFNRNLLMY